jgi:hypothetical protein
VHRDSSILIHEILASLNKEECDGQAYKGKWERCNNLVGKPEDKRPVRRSRHRL